MFTFLTVFRTACDAAGLSHGRAFPLMPFRLAGAAKRLFSSAANTVVRDKRYDLTNCGDGANWLLKKYATHLALATAYHDIITIRWRDFRTFAPESVVVELMSGGRTSNRASL